MLPATIMQRTPCVCSETRAKTNRKQFQQSTIHNIHNVWQMACAATLNRRTGHGQFKRNLNVLAQASPIYYDYLEQRPSNYGNIFKWILGQYSKHISIWKVLAKGCCAAASAFTTRCKWQQKRNSEFLTHAPLKTRIYLYIEREGERDASHFH